MVWLIQKQKEASLTKGNFDFSETYCASNFNKFGRYINIINMKGRRSVLIIPEQTFNSSWMFIAERVERLINIHKSENVPMEPKLIDKNIPYVGALQCIKWSKRRESSFNDRQNKQNEVLSRSLVGNFKDVDTPTLSEIRRWSSHVEANFWAEHL